MSDSEAMTVQIWQFDYIRRLYGPDYAGRVLQFIENQTDAPFSDDC